MFAIPSRKWLTKWRSLVGGLALSGIAAAGIALTPAWADSAFERPYAGVHPVKGTLPVLVVLLRSNDARDTPVITDQQVRTLMFGPGKSVASYFAEVSYGWFGIREAMVTSWIIARDDPSTAVDESRYEFVHSGGDAEIARKGAWLIQQVQQSVPSFRFATYDKNKDGKVTIDELSVFWVYPGESGRGRPTNPAIVPVPGLSKGVEMGLLARAGDHEEMPTYAHELAHQIFGLYDLYADGAGYPGVGSASLMCDNFSSIAHLDPWAKIKLGWLKPRIISEDGWYSLASSETHPDALVLHDPTRGPADYFIVENRSPAQSHEDSWRGKGLAIWRISERNPGGDWARKTIDLIWAGGPPPKEQVSAGFCADRDDALFDGSISATAYSPHSYSTPGKLVWRDGKPSNIAIWHVPPASSQSMIYVDVPPLQSPALVGRPIVIAGSSSDLDLREPPALYLTAVGQRPNDIVGIGMAGDNHVYTWYRNGTVSAGREARLGDYRPPQSFTLPKGKSPADIVGMDIAGDDHVYAWYRDGTVSAGTSRDLGAYRPPQSYALPHGRTPQDIVAIGIAGDDHVYAWYRDGMVSAGTSRKLDAYRPPYRYSVPFGLIPADIADIAIDTRDRVFTWFGERGTGAAIIIGTYMEPGAVTPNRTARLLAKATDANGRPLENVAISVGSSAGAFLSPTRIVSDANGLAQFEWRAPAAQAATYDGQVLIEMRATRHDRSDGRGMVMVPVLGAAIQ